MQAIHLILYNSSDTYMSPSGAIMDCVKVQHDFPAVSNFSFIVETDTYEEMMYGFYSLSAMKAKYDVNNTLTDEEAVQAIEYAMNLEKIIDSQPQPAENPVTAEERIAAALEYQMLNDMEDVE